MPPLGAALFLLARLDLSFASRRGSGSTTASPPLVADRRITETTVMQLRPTSVSDGKRLDVRQLSDRDLGELVLILEAVGAAETAEAIIDAEAIHRKPV